MIETPDLVWHYTSLGALIHILDGNALIATEVRFQNDPHEVRSADNAMQRILKEFGNEPAHAKFSRRALDSFEEVLLGGPYDENAGRLLRSSRFILCASTRDDSLYAWRTYGSVGSVGCAIGLDRKVPLGVVSAEKKQIDTTVWRNMEYSEQVLSESTRNKLESLADEWKRFVENGEFMDDRQILTAGVESIWTDVRARAKHESYRDEHEARVSVTAPPTGAVKFRDSRLGPRPYVFLGAADDWGQPANGILRLPIRAITLGPEASTASVASVNWLLAMHGYVIDGENQVAEYDDEEGNPDTAEWTDHRNTVEIRRSKHAYRSV